MNIRSAHRFLHINSRQVFSVLIFLTLVLISRVLHFYQGGCFPEIMLASGLVFTAEVSSFVREFRDVNSTVEFFQSIAVPVLIYIYIGAANDSKAVQTLYVYACLGFIYMLTLIIINKGSSVKRNMGRILRGVSIGVYNLRIILILIILISLAGIYKDAHAGITIPAPKNGQGTYLRYEIIMYDNLVYADTQCERGC